MLHAYLLQIFAWTYRKWCKYTLSIVHAIFIFMEIRNISISDFYNIQQFDISLTDFMPWLRLTTVARVMYLKAIAPEELFFPL